MSNIREEGNVIYFEEYFKSSTNLLSEVRKKYGMKAEIFSQERIERGIFRHFLPPRIKVVGCVEREDASSNEVLQKNILEELKKLHTMLPHLEGTEHNSTVRNLEGLYEIMEIMERNGFLSCVMEDFQERMLARHTVQELKDRERMHRSFLRYCEERIPLYADVPLQGKKQKVIVLVGPTGMGKSTSIMKLAVHFSQGKSKAKTEDAEIRVVSLDYFKVGAAEQMQNFTQCMKLPFHSCSELEDLHAIMRKGRRPDLLLIDSAGKSPNDKNEVATYTSFFEAKEKVEIYLVLAANVSGNDVINIIEAFSVYNIKGAILTKFDETQNPGTLISACMEKQLPIVFISSGQSLTNSLQRADHKTLCNMLHGVKYGIINNKRGPHGKTA